MLFYRKNGFNIVYLTVEKDFCHFCLANIVDLLFECVDQQIRTYEGCREKTPAVHASTFHITWPNTFWTALIQGWAKGQ